MLANNADDDDDDAMDHRSQVMTAGEAFKLFSVLLQVVGLLVVKFDPPNSPIGQYITQHIHSTAARIDRVFASQLDQRPMRSL